MKLPAEFLQLPLTFDAERLYAEISAVPTEAWRPHPQGFADNDALILVSTGGGQHNDDLSGQMLPTPALKQSPYLQQVMASFATVIGRSRLMRIGGSAEASPHFDQNYYWQQRMRIHVPIRTNPEVRFHCGDRSINMAAGECWVFDTWKIHKVTNPANEPRIHLVCDTVGSGPFWDLLAQSRNPFAVDTAAERDFRPHHVAWQPDRKAALSFERVNLPDVMSPWEQESLLANLLDDLLSADPPAEVYRQFQARLERFRFQWRGLWARYAVSVDGLIAYRHALDQLERHLEKFAGQMELPNGADPVEIVRAIIIEGSKALLPGQAGQAVPQNQHVRQHTGPAVSNEALQIRRPVVIAAAPRSGSTLLFETMAAVDTLVSVGGESHRVIEGLSNLHPAAQHFDSNALAADLADATTIHALRRRFLEAIVAHEPAERLRRLGPDLRLLEKTPKNALRLPFLRQVFPGMRLVYLIRHPRENISSIIDAWRSGRFVTYPELPGWSGSPWSLLLIPGWRDLPAQDIAMIAARQWQVAHEFILDALETLDFAHVAALRYEELIAEPGPVMQELCDRLELPRPGIEDELPLSVHTLTPPDPDKWKRNADELARVLPEIESTWQRLQSWLEQHPQHVLNRHQTLA